jgi:acetyltransferase-like isoleucine patch superfamily enzyme
MVRTIKGFLNTIRNLIMFHVFYPWVKYGRNVHVQSSAVIYSPNKVCVLGNNVGIGHYCVLNTDVVIGNDVMLAAHVGLIARDAHTTDTLGVTMFESPRGDKHRIVIENDVWIGFGAVVLSGVTLERGSIVAAGAVVTRDVPAYSVVAGFPANVVKMRFTPEQIREHERLLGQQGDGGAAHPV